MLNKKKKYEEIPWGEWDEDALNNPKYSSDENEIMAMVDEMFKSDESPKNEYGDGYNHPGDGNPESSIPSRVSARKFPRKYKKQIIKLRDLVGKNKYGK